MPSPTLSRRKLLADSAILTAGALLAPHLKGQQATAASAFISRWEEDLDRVWLGADFWVNPMQDWQVKDGRAECIAAKPNRNVHVLTRELGDHSGDLHMSVRIGRVGGGSLAGNGKGSAGFKIGILGTLRDHPELRDYRNNLAFSSGWDVGFTAAGGLFFGDSRQAEKDAVTLGAVEAVDLDLKVEPAGSSYALTLTVKDAAGGQTLGELKRTDIRPLQLIGNLAIGCNFGPEAGPRAAAKKKARPEGPGLGEFWFSHWSIQGSKVIANEAHRFGPILFNHYTLSNRVMKMSVQMPPLGMADIQEVNMEVKANGSDWKAVAKAPIHPQARTATFEMPGWQDDQDIPYRLAYTLKSKSSEAVHHYEGTVRANPSAQVEFSVADISCNIHTCFPNAPYVASVAKLNPDLMAFVGDQFYESTASYGVQRDPLEPAILDYLRKWYFHGWTWRELTKDRPSISLPDDHDVYQGNLWGMNGAPQGQSQEAGGYQMNPEWVNVVHRTQTSHHPAAYDPEPSEQGISNYYGAMTYGGISFAILADRQFKSAPENNVPATDSRADHVINPDFDPKTADIAGLELLGAKQLQFLEEWARDWKDAEMKAVLSQTIFTGMATTHGTEREVLRIDYDQNGWPQAARNAALKAIRKSFAFHVAGDQHLPALVHYGIDEHRDAGVGFAGPAVNVGYQRWWEPTEKIHKLKPGQGLTGDFTDHFGHPMTVLAVKNGILEPRKDAMGISIDKASGFGMVRFNKKDRTITCECWPFGTDFGQPGAPQFDTWPVVTSQLDQYARKALVHLPKLSINGTAKPLVEVMDAAGELVYALRLASADFQPHVFTEGPYSLRISDPETGKFKMLEGLSAVKDNSETLEVALG
ncbi:PhoD-like phosphatase [Prosthecobacter fusiformis]|uniref:PhoD-like phosphatase n=1 Tax=Prosthecobacter fusiformis TaxID=48464 RepID=A0A4R7SR65_9BACT|nr:alkaline phosphatase D family protein [Prosthecobacter fusiformis]TDU80916.1 PhoD-like phosphatase [Prosthecobacter fusiformis]